MADHSEIARATAAGTVVMICGPTAAGKSGLALALAEESGGVIINADSMQLYRDLRVLTARPGETEMARAPSLSHQAAQSEHADLCKAASSRH